MTIDELRTKFIVDESSIKKDLEATVPRALEYCVVDKSGRVHIKNHKLPGKAKVMLVLAARSIASQLDSSMSPDTTVDEVVSATGLPANQARARLSQACEEKFAECVGRGAYRANFYRVSQFLEELGGGPK